MLVVTNRYLVYFTESQIGVTYRLNFPTWGPATRRHGGPPRFLKREHAAELNAILAAIVASRGLGNTPQAAVAVACQVANAIYGANDCVIRTSTKEETSNIGVSFPDEKVEVCLLTQQMVAAPWGTQEGDYLISELLTVLAGNR